MMADSGPIGGDMSHEFVILAETGESAVFYQKDWFEGKNLKTVVEGDNLQSLVDSFLSKYAATDEKHDPSTCPVDEKDLVATRGIEVGHIFYFGTKYSESLGATVTSPDGSEVPVHMGSYGVGVSRLVGAIIEANHDEKGIIWPEAVTPFRVGLVNIKIDDQKCLETCEEIYASFKEKEVEVLYDDRDERAGTKLNDMDLIGLPWQVVVGPRGIASGLVELKNRRSGSIEDLSVESLKQRFL